MLRSLLRVAALGEEEEELAWEGAAPTAGKPAVSRLFMFLFCPRLREILRNAFAPIALRRKAPIVRR